MVNKKRTVIANVEMKLVEDSTGSTDDGDCCIMAIGGKRCREPPSQLQGFPSLQPQDGERNGCERQGKSRKSVLGDKRTTCNRKWEEMDHEILICIMKRFPWYEWRHIDFVICKSWLSAFLDVLFPPGDILDLRFLDDHAKFGCQYAWKIRKFYQYLKLNLDRRSPNHYTKLILSECILHEQAYRDIAQRLPALKSFVSPAKMSSYLRRFISLWDGGDTFHLGSLMFKYWKNLEDAHCHFTMVWNLAGYLKSIRNLTFIGMVGYRHWLQDNIALAIAKGFPLLDRLSISSFVFSFKGISMILDGHKNLSYLDMTHTVCVPEHVMRTWWRYPTPLDYPWPKDLFDKIASVQTFLTCDRKNCPNCSHLDSR